MMRWFGESWGAPVCDPDYHTDTPIGANCAYFRCGDPILPTDRGLLIPILELDSRSEIKHINFLAYHLDCQVFSVGGFKSHGEKEPCNCDEIFALLRARRLNAN